MKRIAALAALMITMLAVPTAAMASTGGSAPGYGGPGYGGPGYGGPGYGGPGYGRPGPVQVACRLPYRFHQGQIKIAAGETAYRISHRHGEPVQPRFVCPDIPAKPFPGGCQQQVLAFDMAPGSSTLTEVSGPVLAPPQEFTYDGNSYTIVSVNPGADSFTVFHNGGRFVNNGAAITNGSGFMACSS
jgi:hypothetical protein